MSNQREGTSDNRLKILEEGEIDDFFTRPLFTNEERQIYFALSAPENWVIKKLHTYKPRIYFILQLGYFKAKQQFFNFDAQTVAADARYICQTNFPEINEGVFEVSKTTRLKQTPSFWNSASIILVMRYSNKDWKKKGNN